MHAPPPVAVRTGTGRAWRAFQALAWAVSAGVLGLWAMRQLDAGALQAALAGAVAVAAMLPLAWRLSRARPAELQWTGARWLLVDGSGDSRTVADRSVRVDLGGWMLVRLRCREGGTRTRVAWMALSRAEARAQWSALRAALYSPATLTPPGSAPDRADAAE
jgi:hypothetical protein